MSSELSLLVELYNPLYLFPIVGVVFTALMVYAFGFKSSAQPSTEVVDALNDRHHKTQRTSHETVKRKKQTQKSPTTKTETKNQPNGHISNDSRPSERKAAKKVAVEPPSPSKEPKIVKKHKNKKAQENNEVDIDDKNAGEWVELVSKKERKNRKQKEEQQLMDSTESKTNKEDKIADKSHQKSKKNKASKNVEQTSSVAIETDKETIISDAMEKSDSSSSKNQNGVVANEEPVVDLPDIYGLAKEQRPPKKSQKQKNKRNSESEQNSKSEPLIESETKPNLNLSDKLTASIVANYEGIDSKVDVPNKKKEKKKKPVKENSTDSETSNKQVSNSSNIEEKDQKPASPETEVVINNTDTVSDAGVAIAKPSEDEFKVVNKKRRPRRE